MNGGTCTCQGDSANRCPIHGSTVATTTRFPEPQVMSREQSAMVYVLHDAPTNPALCDCGHRGLGMNWHMRPCPVKEALVTVREVLA